MRSPFLRPLRGLAAAALFLIAAVAPTASQEPGPFTLTIVHTNDTHAHLQPYDNYGAACKPSAECYGGVARRATAIRQIRERGGNVILVDAGDQFQGTLFYSQYKGKEAQEFMNALSYQAMALGNHEFDDGTGITAEFIAGTNFPVLAANLDVSDEPRLQGLVKPWTVVNVGGRKVGLVGVITEELAALASPGMRVRVGSVESAVKDSVAALHSQGVTQIIVLSHIGYVADQALAAQVDGIDVIVGGHSHTVLSNTDSGAAGPYPTVVKSPSGAPVLIVQVGAYGRLLGDLQVTFDADGIAQSWSGDSIVLDAAFAEDPAFSARVAELYKPLEQLTRTVVGKAGVDLVGDRTVCRFAECNLGDLITDAMLWKTQNDKTRIAMLNSGAIRSGMLAGDVTMGNVIEVLPFGNMIATFGLKGSDLLAALENAVSRADNPENEGAGRFAQVSGLRFSWDPSKPVGSRIVSVEVGAAPTGFQPLDPNAVYQVAANEFMRSGGDGYTVLAEKAIDAYDYGSLLADTLREYLEQHSPVNPTLEGRITRIE